MKPNSYFMGYILTASTIDCGLWEFRYTPIYISDLKLPLSNIVIAPISVIPTKPNTAKPCASQIARFMGPPWGPPGSCRPQVGPMLAPWTLLSGIFYEIYCPYHWLLAVGVPRHSHIRFQSTAATIELPDDNIAWHSATKIDTAMAANDTLCLKNDYLELP